MRQPIDLAFHPEWIAPDAWVAPGATVLGEVHLGSEVTVLYGAVLRGDSGAVEVGAECNIQDLACLHADPGFPCRLGRRVTVGHAAVVHGATVEDDVLIGIRAVVLNGAVIGQHSIIGAGAVVPEGKVIPPRSLVLGVPGKVIRPIDDEDIARIHHAAAHYVEVGRHQRSQRR